MGWKRRILFVLLLVAILGGLGWLTLRPREPVYQGKTLSFWLERQQEAKYGDQTEKKEELRRQAEEALRHIGTNAIPYLLRMLRSTDSGLRLKLVGLVNKQHLVNFRIKTAMAKNAVATDGFEALREEAADAVPALIYLFENHPSTRTRGFICHIFVSVGPAGQRAIPSLLRAMASTNYDLVSYCADALGAIHAQPDLVVPVMIQLLHDSHLRVRVYAMEVLGAYGANAKAAVPALIEVLNGPDPVLPKGARDGDYVTEKEVAADALREIDPETATKAGVK